MEKQNKTPLYEALVKMKEDRLVPFDVPGHKRGKGNKNLLDFLGEKCLSVDVNSMKPLDNLNHPLSVIKEAGELAALAFKASHAFFMVGGTTSSVQAMIMAVCQEGDKIILPRNVHRSAINALILCGGIPIYIDPQINHQLGISLGMAIQDIEKTIAENPDAKAIFLNNPTYYGICSHIKKITQIAHQYNMKVLVDEAHGTHFYFSPNLPTSAMEAGADMASVSMHKSGGSLTQSSILLLGKDINPDYVRKIINITQTTSPSYLLLSSLDISRRNLALYGEKIFNNVSQMASYTRSEINDINGYYAFSKEIINGDSIFDFDVTKLSINTLNLGLAGIEVYDLLRDEYDVQIEFGDMSNILAYLSVGDSLKDIERLVSALSEIARKFKKQAKPKITQEYLTPKVATSPRKAFYAQKKSLPFSKAIGKVSTEFLMCYPPGIPILAPGEFVTPEIVSYLDYAKKKGFLIIGTEDMNLEKICVIHKE